MKPDIIFSNPPYGKPGVDIVHHLMNHQKQAQMSMLGNISMFKRYADRMAIQLVQIGAFEYGTNKRLPWGVEQAIFLATTNGYTVVIKNKLSGETRNEYIPNLETTVFQNVGALMNDSYARLRGLNCVIANISEITGKQQMTSHCLSTTSVDKIVCPAKHDIKQKLQMTYRDVNAIYTKENPTVEMPMGAINLYKYTDTRTGNIQEHPLCRPGRVYRVFDTAEEAYECALDLVSWVNPTDSHDRCVKWGFITDYQPHYVWEK